MKSRVRLKWYVSAKWLPDLPGLRSSASLFRVVAETKRGLPKAADVTKTEIQTLRYHNTINDHDVLPID